MNGDHPCEIMPIADKQKREKLRTKFLDSTVNHTVSTEIEPSDLAQVAVLIHSRQLATPLLLLLVGHRPLTFITGQLLLALAPMCALLGWEKADAWATFLSAPNANQQIMDALNSPPIDSAKLYTSHHQDRSAS